MKRIFLCALCLLLIGSLFLSGCGEKSIDGLPMPQCGEGLKVGEDTYYIGEYPGLPVELDMLCRIPQGERMPIPVCGKPGCHHNDSSCDGVYQTYMPEESSSVGSSTGFFTSSVGFFRDRLYTLSALPGREIAVYSVNLETAERQQEWVLDPQEVYDTELASVTVSGAFHENSLILLYTKTGENVSGPIHRMILLDLATGKQKEVLRDHFDECIAGEYVRVEAGPMAVGNMVYIAEYGQRKLPNSNKYVSEHWLSQFNLSTGEATQFFGDDLFFTWRIEGDKVFFFDQTENRFKEFDLPTGELTVIPSEEDKHGSSYYLDDLIVHVISELEFDDKMAIKAVHYSFQFYSRDYTRLDTLENEDASLVFCFSTKEALYFRSDEGMFYLNRSDIGSNNLKLQPLT